MTQPAGCERTGIVPAPPSRLPEVQGHPAVEAMLGEGFAEIRQGCSRKAEEELVFCRLVAEGGGKERDRLLPHQRTPAG